MLPAACLRTWANVDEWEAARGGQWMRGGRGVKPWHVGGGRARESLEDAEEGWAWNWQGNFKRKAMHAFTLWKPVADAMCMSVKSILRFYIDYCLLWPPPNPHCYNRPNRRGINKRMCRRWPKCTKEESCLRYQGCDGDYRRQEGRCTRDESGAWRRGDVHLKIVLDVIKDTAGADGGVKKNPKQLFSSLAAVV